jgi:hypothetical protein
MYHKPSQESAICRWIEWYHHGVISICSSIVLFLDFFFWRYLFLFLVANTCQKQLRMLHFEMPTSITGRSTVGWCNNGVAMVAYPMDLVGL